MSYLYGDSTPSKLEVNYIEFLRDAVECCARVLLADQHIAEGAARTRALEAETAAEIARLQKVGALVPKAFEGTPVGDAASATARCVAAVVRSAADIVRAAAAEANASFEAAVDRRDAEAAVEREVFIKALEALLIKHDLPEMTSQTNVSWVDGARYACRLHVATPFGLQAALELEVPAGHLLERVVRIDRLAERLEIEVPEISGWLHKELKLRTQHLEKHHFMGLSSGPAGSTLHLRLAPDGTGPGYDVTFEDPDGPIRLVRVDEQQKREEPFEAQQADVPKLRTLREKLAAALSELARHRTKIVEAKLDGESLQGHAKPTLLVERLIAVLVPETREIAARSQSRSELVLRRSLGGDRREEIFLSRQELTLKLEPLDDRNRALFDSLLREEGAPASRSEPPPVPPPRAAPPAKPSADGAASSASASAPRVLTPLYGVTPLAAMSPPAGGEAPPKKPGALEVRGPERPSAVALDRPPPAVVTGEIGNLPEEKRSEPSRP
ncbi:MAG TPA: hypothetical protein VLC06_25165 [Polyangia bacterium]|nr:hypothetical protein [Polyangia bacterium]